MNSTVKTLLIVGGSIVVVYVGYKAYVKYKGTIATTPAPAPGQTGIASGITTANQIAAGAGGLLTQLGNLFGAHATTATTAGAAPNPSPNTSTGSNYDVDNDPLYDPSTPEDDADLG